MSLASRWQVVCDGKRENKKSQHQDLRVGLGCEEPLNQYFLDDVSVNIRQTPFQSVVIKREAFVIESHQVEKRCVEVVNTGRVDGGLKTELVAFAVTETFFYTRTGQEARERVRVVIAASSVGLKEWHATKFGRPNNQRIFK